MVSLFSSGYFFRNKLNTNLREDDPKLLKQKMNADKNKLKLYSKTL